MKMKIVIFALIFAALAGLAVPAFISTPASAHSPSSTAITTTPTTTTTTLGPMLIGMQTSGNTFVGIAASIKLGGDGSLKLANIKGLSLDGTFKVTFAYDVAPTPGGSGAIIGKTLTSSGKLPKGNTIAGSYFDLGMLNANLSGDYFFLMGTFGNSDQQWGALLIGNMPGTITILPQILTTMGGPDITSIMPTLKGLITLVNPFMQKHPIIVIMPMDSFIKLMPLMGMGG
jgi:hypothetical protein